LLVTEECVRGEVLSSGWIINGIQSKEMDRLISHFTYAVQLGSKALSIAMGDITGESKWMAKSIENVKAHFANSKT